MKLSIILVSVALAIAVTPAMAQKKLKVNATGTGTATSSSNSGAVAVSGGSTSSVTFNTPGRQTIHTRSSGSVDTTANAIAPGLGSAAVETCYGPGVSAGVGFTGGAFSFGMGQFDVDCNARLYSRTLYAMGHKQAALQLLINESQMVQKAFGVGPGGAAVTPRGLVYGNGGAVRPVAGGGNCGRWSGGATGVGTCLWYN